VLDSCHRFGMDVIEMNNQTYYTIWAILFVALAIALGVAVSVIR
jgi:hypothetical protein